MKYLIVLSSLILAGCSFDNEVIAGLERLQKETQYNLQSCQSQLETYRSSGSSSDLNDSYQEPAKPAEPEYEEVEYADLYLNLTKVRCYDREVEACGMTFTTCADGFVYRCMKDAKYKIGTEQKLVE